MRVIDCQRFSIFVIIKLLSLQALISEHLSFFRFRSGALILVGFIFPRPIPGILAWYGWTVSDSYWFKLVWKGIYQKVCILHYRGWVARIWKWFSYIDVSDHNLVVVIISQVPTLTITALWAMCDRRCRLPKAVRAIYAPSHLRVILYRPLHYRSRLLAPLFLIIFGVANSLLLLIDFCIRLLNTKSWV